MNQRRLGRTGLKVSEICLGTMTFANQTDETTAARILDTAVGRGVTFIDTADCYPIPPDPETAGATEVAFMLMTVRSTARYRKQRAQRRKGKRGQGTAPGSKRTAACEPFRRSPRTAIHHALRKGPRVSKGMWPTTTMPT